MNRVHIGKDRRGKDKYKLLWEINPETAPILHQIIVDWRISEELSYKAIRERLNSMSIPGPEGRPWGISTIVEMLRENRLYQYTGIYYWNKEDHKTPGTRYKDKSEWVEVPNAHPANITIDEAEAALALTKNRQPRTPAARSYDSPWLLTGQNLEGKPFFTCKVCGGNMIGVRRSEHLADYVCGQHHYKGNAGCTNNRKINHRLIEARLLIQIEEVFGAPEAIDDLVEQVNTRLNKELESYNSGLSFVQTEIAKCDEQIEATFLAFSKGLDSDLCNERLSNLKNTRIELSVKYDELQKCRPQELWMDSKKAHDYFVNSRKIYESGTNEEKAI